MLCVLLNITLCFKKVIIKHTYYKLTRTTLPNIHITKIDTINLNNVNPRMTRRLCRLQGIIFDLIRIYRILKRGWLRGKVFSAEFSIFDLVRIIDKVFTLLSSGDINKTTL